MEKGGKRMLLEPQSWKATCGGQKTTSVTSASKDTHRQKLEEIYLAIQKSMGWPAIEFQLDSNKD